MADHQVLCSNCYRLSVTKFAKAVEFRP